MLPTLVGIILCYLISFLFTSIAWYILLNSVGEKPRLPHVLATILLSQFAKYLPGNIGHHVGRVVLAHNSGLANGSIVLTMLLEIFIVTLAAGGVGVLSFILDNSILLPSILERDALDKIFVFGLIIVTVLVYILLQRPFPSKYLYSRCKVEKIRLPKLLPILSCFLLYSTNFLILGAILYVLMHSFMNSISGDFWLLTGVFSVAWLVGFVAPGAPAGLGVREAILVAALDPIYGSGVSLSLAISLRMITTVGDGIGFITGLVLRQWLK